MKQYDDYLVDGSNSRDIQHGGTVGSKRDRKTVGRFYLNAYLLSGTVWRDDRLTVLIHTGFVASIWHWLNAALTENMILTWGTLKG